MVGATCDGDRLGARHPGDRAVGDDAGQLQHRRPKRSDQDRRGGRARHRDGHEGVGRHLLALAVDGLTAQHRHQRRQVLTHVGAGLGEAHAPRTLDHDLVGEPDAEEKAVVGRRLHGQGLLGEHHRVPGVDGHHAGTQADARYLRTGRGQQRQGVGPEDLHGEGMVEPSLVSPPQLGHDVGQRPVDVDQGADSQGLGHRLNAPRLGCRRVCPTVYANPPTGASELTAHHVGFVGAGQLARMAGEAASALGLSMAVLAERPDDAACEVAAEVVLGSPLVASELRDLRPLCGRDLRPRAGRSGPGGRPGRGGHDRPAGSGHPGDGRGQGAHAHRARRAGVPVPAYAVVDPARADLRGRGRRVRCSPRLAAHRQGGTRRLRRQGRLAGRKPGGGGGVLADIAGRAVLEELLPLEAEIAVVVARRPSGEALAWPAVETAQLDGVCREVLVPGRLPAEVLAEASELGRRWPTSPVPSG